MALSPEEMLEWADKVRVASELGPLAELVLSERNPPPHPFRIESDCHGFEPPRDARLDFIDRPLRAGPGGGRYYVHTDFID